LPLLGKDGGRANSWLVRHAGQTGWQGRRTLQACIRPGGITAPSKSTERSRASCTPTRRLSRTVGVFAKTTSRFDRKRLTGLIQQLNAVFWTSARIVIGAWDPSSNNAPMPAIATLETPVRSTGSCAASGCPLYHHTNSLALNTPGPNCNHPKVG
jgi:hypothetical protein